MSAWSGTGTMWQARSEMPLYVSRGCMARTPAAACPRCRHGGDTRWQPFRCRASGTLAALRAPPIGRGQADDLNFVMTSHPADQSQDFTCRDFWRMNAHNVAIEFLDDIHGGAPQTNWSLYASSVILNDHINAGVCLCYSREYSFSWPSGTSTLFSTRT